MSPRPHARRPGFLIIGLILLFVICGVLAWTAWSRDAETSIDNSADAIVQPSEVPPPGRNTPARPQNDGTDATGDAVVSDRNRS
jgi:hypothetical protein